MISVYFGNPGCGKTTLICKLAKKSRRQYDHAYINFYNSVPGAYSCDLSDLGDWTFQPHSLVLIDEAGIEYNSRAYKALPKKTIAWFKKHRHYQCDCVVFSQSFEDMDVTLRRLAVEYWYLYRIGPWTLSRRMYKRFGIDKNTEQPIDKWSLASMWWLVFWPFQLGSNKRFRLTFRPFYYKYFDSWSTDELPVKDFPVNNTRPAAEHDSAPDDMDEE